MRQLNLIACMCLSCLTISMLGCQRETADKPAAEVTMESKTAGEPSEPKTDAATQLDADSHSPLEEPQQEASKKEKGEKELLVAPEGTQAAMEKDKSTGASELPDSKLSSEASDLNVEPEPMDLRKHDPVFAADTNWTKLAKDYPLWIDQDKKQVIVDGRIAQIHAALEMFACPVDSGKEHESIVGVYCESELVHAALLAVGAKPGHPVIFQPEFKPAAGTKIQIEIQWEVDGKRKTADAKNWIRDMQSKETLKMDWVFGGSEIYVDDRNGNKYYLANGGEMVCVSNFSTAMLDLPVESSADAAQQVYETNTDEIPALGTPVRLIFKPQSEADKNEAAEENPPAPEKAIDENPNSDNK